MTLTDRLRQFIATTGLSNSQFADKAGIPRPTLSQLLHGRNKSISDQLLRKLDETFPELNLMWLLFGRGEMRELSNIKSSEPQIEPENEFDEAYMLDTEDSDDYETMPSPNLFSESGIESAFKAARRKAEQTPPTPGAELRREAQRSAGRPVAPMQDAAQGAAVFQPAPAGDSAEPGRGGLDAASVAAMIEAPEGKKIQSIIVLYTDNSFETFKAAK